MQTVTLPWEVNSEMCQLPNPMPADTGRPTRESVQIKRQKSKKPISSTSPFTSLSTIKQKPFQDFSSFLPPFIVGASTKESPYMVHHTKREKEKVPTLALIHSQSSPYLSYSQLNDHTHQHCKHFMAKPYSSMSCLIITTFTLLQLIFPSQEVKITPPPLPILPLPNYAQLKWQKRELIMFFHFGVNTFTNREWGTGHENPAIFNPTRLDANQWVDTAVQAGVSLIILTAKHHDGFCLWPSKFTDHSVIRSPWKNGQGDVVQDFVNAAKARGVDIGLYLSPWDRHDKRYGKNKKYNEHYLAQLQELLNKYGDVKEMWFDGAKGSNAPNMTYYFDDWFAMVRELQSTYNIFSDAGPGVRWVGNEDGFAGSTSWSTINRTLLSIGNSNADYLNSGDPKGTDWLPPECDVSIRKGWFWHKSQAPKNLSDLLEIYYKSVGRNCVLLLNVPPNKQGLISDSDVQRLKEFRSAIDTIFSTNLATKCSIKASSQRGGKNGDFGPENVLDNDRLWTYWAPRDEDEDDHWIEFKAKDKPLRFNVVRIQEAIGLGQRIKKHEIYVNGMKIANGTTIGYKKLHRLEKATVSGYSVRIKIIESRAIPLISSVGLHFDPFWSPNGQVAT